MKFMNKFINPPCNSHFLRNCTYTRSEKSVILLEDISSSQAGIESVVSLTVTDAAVCPFPLDAPEEKVFGERGEESSMGGPERPVEEVDVRETEACTEADVNDEDVGVVGGVAYIDVSG